MKYFYFLIKNKKTIYVYFFKKLMNEITGKFSV